MPVHDWSRVRPGRFHHFHNSWIYRLSDRLNGGILPPGFYAAGEQIVGDIEPDVVTLQREPTGADDWRSAAGVVALEEQPPRVRFTVEADEEAYIRKQDRLTIRSSDGDQIVALIEILSKGNKDSHRRTEQFLHKVAHALDSGVHVLLVDIQPRGSFDPDGIHAAIWTYLFGRCPQVPADQPLTLVSYRADSISTAYFEPANVGDTLPDMPLFLDVDRYVNAPLEETYMQAWEGFPEPWKTELVEAE